ncbi:hypothetical protein C9374_011800 [Naegleria lovaniensis]|uniref:Uncharacterized protein n=1 Tax=Naegleria lovaniensis TaxID=51637 RepID=A0AA88GGL6_NAELO|nr:uncharacterized protein C9374_011800 [Naegleria lovaniensis]KAG2373711.1 hypothetical protein C9374_011800 [Naegleria lovaniensis]
MKVPSSQSLDQCLSTTIDLIQQLLVAMAEQQVDDQRVSQLALAIKDQITHLDKKFKKNMISQLLVKRLFSFGLYAHQDFNSTIFKFNLKDVQEFVRQCKRKTPLLSLIDEIYYHVPYELKDSLCKVVDTVTTERYTRNYSSNLIYREIEIYDQDEDSDDEGECNNQTIEKVVSRKKLEKKTIIIDEVHQKIYWAKESIEDFVLFFKMKSLVASSENTFQHEQEKETLSEIMALIEHIRKDQVQTIVKANTIDFDILESIEDPRIRQQINAIKKKNTENQKIRELFSKGFNSNQFHFILEFIQNADDSVYPDNSTHGTVDRNKKGHLIFHFDSKSKTLTITSNERGFTYDNLYSLAGIASSDKVSNKLETKSIGEKGIGFKTIFSVCDNVLLQSNGFEVNLTPDSVEPTYSESNFNFNNGTRYELKFPNSIENFDYLSVFDEHILLTLKSLGKISFKIDSSVYEYSCEMCEGQQVLYAFRNGIETSRKQFFCFTEMIDMTQLAKTCQKRANFDSTTLQIFIPTAVRLDQTFKVHAFLPVNADSAALRFLVQSDFLLSQNRETILDNNWNKEIISHIAPLFMKSYVGSLKHDVNWRAGFFTLLTKKPKGLFERFSEDIRKLALTTDCILTYSPNGREERFVKPSQVIRGFTKLPKHPYTMFGEEFCFNVLQKYSINSELDENIYCTQELQISEFTSQDFMKLLKSCSQEQIKANILGIFHLLQHFSVDLSRVGFPIILTDNGTLISGTQYVIIDSKLPKLLIQELEKHNIYFLHYSLAKFKALIPKQLDISSVFNSNFNNSLTFVVQVACDIQYEYGKDFNIKCLTTNGEWKDCRECYEQNLNTSFLGDTVSFCDIQACCNIVSEFDKSLARTLVQLLKRRGLRVVPQLFNSFLAPRNEFTLLKNHHDTYEKLLQYFDRNWHIYEHNQQQYISHYLNTVVIMNDCSISDLYDGSLQHEFGSCLTYFPTLNNSQFASSLNYKKKADSNAYMKLVEKSSELGVDQFTRAILKAIQNNQQYQLIDLLKTKPLLSSSEGTRIKFDTDKIFEHVPGYIKKLHPTIHELDPKVVPYIRALTEKLWSPRLKTLPYDLIITVLETDEKISYDNQIQLLECVICHGDEKEKKSLLSKKIFTVGGCKLSAAELCWKLDPSIKFPPNIETRLLDPLFSKSLHIKQFLAPHTKEQNLKPELQQLLQSLIDKVNEATENGLSENEIKHINYLFSLIETKAISGVMVNPPKWVVWDLPVELSSISFFSQYYFSHKFNKYKQRAHQLLQNVLCKHLDSNIILQYLFSEEVTDKQFTVICHYISKHNITFGNAFTTQALLVCNNQKQKAQNLWLAQSEEISSNFPQLTTRVITKHYSDDIVVQFCKNVGVKERIPFTVIADEIEKLEQSTEPNTIIDQQISVLYGELSIHRTRFSN